MGNYHMCCIFNNRVLLSVFSVDFLHLDAFWRIYIYIFFFIANMLELKTDIQNQAQLQTEAECRSEVK